MFVEAGACNGELLSNTLFFELMRGWTGVLIEPNPIYFEELLQKHRRAYKINACLSPSDKPERLTFQNAKVYGGLVDFVNTNRRNMHIQHQSNMETQCFPLYSILMAAGLSHVDYCALDIEGSEVPVLTSFPWGIQDMAIDVFGVEVNPTEEGRDSKTILEAHGYRSMEAPFDLDVIMIQKYININSDVYNERKSEIQYKQIKATGNGI